MSLAGQMVGTYGLLRLLRSSVFMKTMRIVNADRCVYVERQYFRRWWVRVSPYYRSNIEAYNWVRGKSDVKLLKKQ